MNIVLYGSTGMIGSAVLIECFEDPEVREVLVVNRRPCGVKHDKLKELLLPDFLDYSDVENKLVGYDACLYCLGIASAGLNEEEYSRITVDFTMAAAHALKKANPQMCFIFISGAGSDSSGKSRSMWARVKGKAENEVLAAGFSRAHAIRPAYIQPMKGVKSRTRLYSAMYTVTGPLFPLIKLFGPKYITSSDKLGRAMIRAARDGYEKPVLESVDINILAERTNA